MLSFMFSVACGYPVPIGFYLSSENFWLLFQPKTGIQVPKSLPLMYIKKKKEKKKKVCCLSKREVLFRSLVRKKNC